jgi:two-component sensor histidine kinase
VEPLRLSGFRSSGRALAGHDVTLIVTPLGRREDGNAIQAAAAVRGTPGADSCLGNDNRGREMGGVTRSGAPDRPRGGGGASAAAGMRGLGIAAAVSGAFCAAHLAWMATTLGGVRTTTWFDDLAELVAALAAAAMCARAALRLAGAARRPWAMIAASALSWGAGEAAWSWYELVQRREVPFPSPADAGFLLAVPLAVVAVLLFAGAHSVASRARAVIDGLIIATAVFSMSWATVLSTVYHARGDTRLATLLSLAYPLGDLLIVTMLLLLVSRALCHGRVALLLLSAGLGAAALADGALAYQSVSGSAGHGNLVDTGRVAGYLLIGLAGLHASNRPRARLGASGPSSLRWLVPYLPVAVAVILAVEELRGRTVDPVLFASMLLLVALVVVRQGLTLMDGADLRRRLGGRDRRIDHRPARDPLTEVATPTDLREHAAGTISFTELRGGPPPAVLRVDVDGIRMVDDTLGPSVAAGADGVRLWLARELHDDALQTLTAMLIEMEEVRRERPDTGDGHRLPDFQASVRSVISGLRRLLGDLREQSGEDHGLVDHLTTLLGQLDHRAGIKGQISVSPEWPTSLSAHLASNLRRIAEEALRNVALHSGAERVMVSLEVEEERLVLTVSDDGHGCLGTCPRGTGMLGMEERALILGGRLEVLSDPGAGTMVRGTFSPVGTA